MIQGNQNQMDKALFALILHTIQETEEAEKQEDETGESENLHLDKDNTYSFAEI